MRTLSRAEARRFYDRLGAGQDGQSWYEDPPIDALIAHAGFEEAQAIFELGCGTGRLARRLLAHHLPSTARYHGVDISPVMAGLARERLAAFAERARVVHTDGEPHVDRGDASVDRFLATYVLDLLPDADIDAWLGEAARVLVPGGRLCVVGLGRGRGPGSRAVAGLWSLVQRLWPAAVGGCRPLSLRRRLEAGHWRVDYRATVVACGVPSEVVVARRQE